MNNQNMFNNFFQIILNSTKYFGEVKKHLQMWNLFGSKIRLALSKLKKQSKVILVKYMTV